MNKSIISVLFKSFATRASSRIHGQYSISPNDIDDDADDLDKYEGDFMNLDKAHVMHERQEILNKKMLGRRITKSQYLKENGDPQFLTHVEKIQIRALHNSDPEEWTVQKLSNSFPALPHVIEKLVKCKWQPTSIARVVRADNIVNENWANLRAGKLAVSHQLKMHLMRFMDRKISTVDREALASQFVRPQYEVPETKNRLFQNLGEAILNDGKAAESGTKLLQNKEKGLTTQISAIEKITKVAQSNRQDKKPIKFDEFIERKMDKLDAESLSSKRKLLATFEKCVQERMTHENMSEHSTCSVEDKSTQLTQSPVCDILHMADSIDLNFENTVTTEQNSLSTCIRERRIKITEEEDYTICIKIPKNLYQKGMTYRIKDCYYDDDGEFLFRVM